MKRTYNQKKISPKKEKRTYNPPEKVEEKKEFKELEKVKVKKKKK